MSGQTPSVPQLLPACHYVQCATHTSAASTDVTPTAAAAALEVFVCGEHELLKGHALAVAV